jgi:hypothetical protein
MNAGLLIANVNAVRVISIIHWVGVGFVFLWFLGSCVRDGMWNNAIRCFNAFVAATISFPIAITIRAVLEMIVGIKAGSTDANDVYMQAAIAIGGGWVAFIICLAVLQTLTDKLSQVKVPFHPIVNTVGSVIFICGITFVMFSMCAPVLGLVLATK